MISIESLTRNVLCLIKLNQNHPLIAIVSQYPGMRRKRKMIMIFLWSFGPRNCLFESWNFITLFFTVYVWTRKTNNFCFLILCKKKQKNPQHTRYNESTSLNKSHWEFWINSEFLKTFVHFAFYTALNVILKFIYDILLVPTWLACLSKHFQIFFVFSRAVVFKTTFSTCSTGLRSGD